MSQETTTENVSNQVDAALLEILRCPLTHSKLQQQGDFLVAEVGGISYPVREGIPVMLPEEAKLPEGFTSLDQYKQQFMKK